MHNIVEYYRDTAVRARMVEFLGGPNLAEASTVYLRPTTPGDQELDVPRCRPADLWQCLDASQDIARSMWDRSSLLLDLDIEYVNFDYPAEAYLDPERVFAMQEPVEHVIQEVLLEFGLAPLHLMSGRGHHLLWRVSQPSEAFARLATLGRLSEFMEGLVDAPEEPSGETVPRPVLQAFAGAALVMEYVAHLLKDRAAPVCPVPVELTALRVGCHGYGREIVSIDISEYGDPLASRCLRIPFSVYHKPWRLQDDLGATLQTMQPIFLIPRHEMSLQESLLTMRSPEATRRLARHASTAIPRHDDATLRLIDAYENSRLAGFHRWFYEVEHEPPESWPETYDRMPLHTLPTCVRHVLDHPNDLLLKPAGLQVVVRTMLALGWHPRHIAGLIRSKYERDFGWGHRWYRDNAGSRADFYTRVFAGLAATGLDELVDFNCRSAQEKDFCFATDPSCNLEDYRNSLLERIRHERLASGPFNGLFLPDQHL